MSLKWTIAAAAALALVACKEMPTTPGGPGLAAGTYTLTRVNGSPPPFVIQAGPFDTTWVIGGQVIVGDSTMEIRLEQHYWFVAGKEQTGTFDWGHSRFSVRGDSVWWGVRHCPFGATCLPPPWAGRFAGDSLELAADKIPRDPVYRFERTDSTPSRGARTRGVTKPLPFPSPSLRAHARAPNPRPDRNPHRPYSPS